MLASKGGPDFFGNVEMSLRVDDAKHLVTGGFQYYP
jgi:hypothetical protein